MAGAPAGPAGALVGAVLGGAAVLLAFFFGSAAVRKWVAQNASAVNAARDDKTGEPTPIVPRGVTFTKGRAGGKTYWRRASDGHLFVEDTSHLQAAPSVAKPHYEVYRNTRSLESGRRDRSVTWDGHRMG